jgi:hypothetical protein
VCRYPWRVPDDFRGVYRVKLSVPLGPFEVVNEDQWFLVEPLVTAVD